MTLYTARYEGTEITRRSDRAYTHASIYRSPYSGQIEARFHSTAKAAKAAVHNYFPEPHHKAIAIVEVEAA